MRFQALLLAVFLAGAVSCTRTVHSPAGFRLPESGDVERGKAAFMELKCYACHAVDGVNLPAATVDPPVPVALGGEVREIRTDGYLVTAIIHPSHKIRGYPKEAVSVEGMSRMPEYAHNMTVRQLVDIIAFLQSRYRPAPPPMMYH